jgi:signal transduction histidine kinase
MPNNETRAHLFKDGLKDADLTTPRSRSKLIQKLIVDLRPVHSMPGWVRYAFATVIVLVCFTMRWSLSDVMHYSPYLLFLLAVILTSLLFDRGTGFYSVFLSAALAYYFFIPSHHAASLVGLTVFLILGLFTAAIIEALRESIDELATTTGNLIESNKKLKDANRRLQESNLLLDDFAYIISHDLKEPIRGIDSFSSFLLEDYKDKLDTEGQIHLVRLKNMSTRMNEMIGDLLNYCRAGRDDGAETVDVNAIIKNILDLMRMQIEQGNVTVSIRTPLPTIYCSKAHLGEIFRNLITNSIKYNDSPAKKIEIGSIMGHAKHPEGHIFYVADNGIGIPEEYRQAVFKMFKRLHGREQYGGGTGAGLAIVKRLVDLHHGEIWIESNPQGQGSIFYFYVDCA